jgi:aminoglycoside phosphotransferase (APT) family kinase protein
MSSRVSPVSRSPGPLVVALEAAVSAALAGTPVRPRYLRRKAGRGLVVVYSVGRWGRPSRGTPPWLTATVDEHALSSGHTLEELSRTSDLGQGVPGIHLERFPADRRLPAVRDMARVPLSGPVLDAVAAAMGARPGGARVPVRAIAHEVVRYKPGARCVVRYCAPTARGPAVVYAKAHADRTIAARSHALATVLWSASGRGRAPVPRPVGLVDELGVVLDEGVGAGAPSADTPRMWARGDEASLRVAAAARALAFVHATEPAVEALPRRECGSDAAAVLERAREVAATLPRCADEVLSVASSVAEALADLPPGPERLGHGAYKPSQLVFDAAGDVWVTDFDGACLSDPARDVGCFLAYLRSALRLPMGASDKRFATLRATFLRGYGDAMDAFGASERELHSTARRALVFEAALQFKIATRRVHRLNSPRSGEARALSHVARACLTSYASSGGVAS